MRLRRVVHWFALLAMVTLATTAVSAASMVADGASPALADEGLTVGSTYTYTVDPMANVVHVVAEMSFRNVVPDEEQGGVVSRTYFSGFAVPLPVEAVNIAATDRGQPVTLVPEFIDGTDDYFLENIDFSSNLFNGQRADIVLTYDIVGRPPRDLAPTRVNGAYVGFIAFGIADPGNLTVRVVVPEGFAVDTFGDSTTQTEQSNEGGNTIYTATGIEQPNEFDLFISARNDAGLTSDPHAVGTAEFVIRSWPDDTGWKDFVTQRIDQSVPALESLLGRSWPEDRPVEIREAVTASLYGYAGWYDSADQQLEIGEDLDPDVIVHELSHAWFNDGWFGERWINEGLAQTYAELVDERLGATPDVPDPVDPAAPGAQPLLTWGDTTLTDGAGDAETYGYNASWFVVDSLIDEIGVERMAGLLAAVDTGAIAYAGEGRPEAVTGATDWRRLLDLAEEVGGSQTAADLIARYVVPPDQLPLLDARSTARAAYDGLQAEGGRWSPPLVVREQMAAWAFPDAQTAIDAAGELLDERDELVATLDDLGLAIDPAIERAYETAGSDLSEPAALLDDASADAAGVVEDRDRTLAAMAAIGVEPTGDFADVYRSEGSSLDTIGARLADLDDATARVADAIAAEADSRSVVERVGLIGTDSGADLDDARAALADGDTDRARREAASVVDTLDGSDAAGQRRSVVAVAILSGGVLAVGLVLIRRRRSAAADQP